MYRFEKPVFIVVLRMEKVVGEDPRTAGRIDAPEGREETEDEKANDPDWCEEVEKADSRDGSKGNAKDVLDLMGLGSSTRPVIRRVLAESGMLIHKSLIKKESLNSAKKFSARSETRVLRSTARTADRALEVIKDRALSPHNNGDRGAVDIEDNPTAVRGHRDEEHTTVPNGGQNPNAMTVNVTGKATEAESAVNVDSGMATLCETATVGMPQEGDLLDMAIFHQRSVMKCSTCKAQGSMKRVGGAGRQKERGSAKCAQST